MSGSSKIRALFEGGDLGRRHFVVVVVIDCCETKFIRKLQHADFESYLKDPRVRWTTARLKTADIVFYKIRADKFRNGGACLEPEYIFERKTYADLVNSISDGRTDNIVRMYQSATSHGRLPGMILEGVSDHTRSFGVHKNGRPFIKAAKGSHMNAECIMGFTYSLSGRMHVYHTKNLAHTIFVCHKLAETLYNGSAISYLDRCEYLPMPIAQLVVGESGEMAIVQKKRNLSAMIVSGSACTAETRTCPRDENSTLHYTLTCVQSFTSGRALWEVRLHESHQYVGLAMELVHEMSCEVPGFGGECAIIGNGNLHQQQYFLLFDVHVLQSGKWSVAYFDLLPKLQQLTNPMNHIVLSNLLCWNGNLLAVDILSYKIVNSGHQLFTGIDVADIVISPTNANTDIDITALGNILVFAAIGLLIDLMELSGCSIIGILALEEILNKTRAEQPLLFQWKADGEIPAEILQYIGWNLSLSAETVRGAIKKWLDFIPATNTHVNFEAEDEEEE